MPENDTGWLDITSTLGAEDRDYWGEVKRDMSNIGSGDRESAFRARVESGVNEIQSEYDKYLFHIIFRYSLINKV